MTKAITVDRKFHVRSGRRNRQQIRTGETTMNATGRIPRISRLMALAIRFDQLIRDGVVTDQAELARLGRVSRARLTQVMNLLNLAPNIQEDLLILSVGEQSHSLATERALRHVAAVLDWRDQRRMWFGGATRR